MHAKSILSLLLTSFLILACSKEQTASPAITKSAVTRKILLKVAMTVQFAVMALVV